MNMIHSLPPGFHDRWMRGPCNVECAHPECPVMRAELRAWAEKMMIYQFSHSRRKAMVRR